MHILKLECGGGVDTAQYTKFETPDPVLETCSFPENSKSVLSLAVKVSPESGSLFNIGFRSSQLVRFQAWKILQSEEF